MSSVTPASIVSQVNDDFNNLISEGRAVIQRVETDALEDIEAGYVWLKSELSKLVPEVLADLKADVQKALDDAMKGGTGATNIVADVLSLLATQGSGVLASVESNVLVAFVGFVTTTVASL